MTAAQKQHPDLRFDIEWLPFQLNPNAPRNKGVNKMEYYQQKFGVSDPKQHPMFQRLTTAGHDVGIEFSFGGDTGNTFDSHRLIYLAYQQNKQDAVVEELFKNYFEQEKGIFDMAVLEKCAVKCGVEGFGKLRDDPEYLAGEVRALLQAPHMGRVRGVPHFLVDEKFEMSGAQPADHFEELFGHVVKEREGAA